MPHKKCHKTVKFSHDLINLRDLKGCSYHLHLHDLFVIQAAELDAAAIPAMSVLQERMMLTCSSVDFEIF